MIPQKGEQLASKYQLPLVFILFVRLDIPMLRCWLPYACACGNYVISCACRSTPAGGLHEKSKRHRLKNHAYDTQSQLRVSHAYKVMMRPLSKDEETDAEVTWEDQNNINTFSKLHNNLQDLQDLLAQKNVPPYSRHHCSDSRHIWSQSQMLYRRSSY